MRCGGSSGDLIQDIDFRIVLPGLARLPLFAGERLARCRGVLQLLFDYDWRSMALKQRYIRRNAYEAMKLIFPGAGRTRWLLELATRFQHYSLEEYQACLFGRPVISDIAKRSYVEGLDHLASFHREGRGVVMLTAHYDSFAMGIVLLGMNGLPTNCLSSAVVEDPRVHPAVRDFFVRKYARMGDHLLGSKIFHYEKDINFFYRALDNAEVVVILGDVPGAHSTVSIPFLGRNFRMPIGAWHMAKKTGSPIGAFLCLRQGTGRYRIVTCPPREIDPESPVKTLEPMYRFIEGWIRRCPGRWLTPELLLSPGYSESPSCQGE